MERVFLKDFDMVYMCCIFENKSFVEMVDCGVRVIFFLVNGQYLYVLCKVGMSVYEVFSGRWFCGNWFICVNFFVLLLNDKLILF